MKRICIYVTYDSKQKVADYIGYFLYALRQSVTTLVVVCNYTEIFFGEENLSCADQVFFRKNIGFDAGAYKDVFCNLLGWEEIDQYEELLLINDSFYGPFSDLNEYFTQAENTEGDFWGAIEHGELASDDQGNFIPRHLQSFFLAIRQPMLSSHEFHEYWESLPYFNRFGDVVKGFELDFTEHFSKLGYRHFSMANTAANDSENGHNYPQYIYLSHELITRRNFPFLKRQQLMYHKLKAATQENDIRALQYIDQNTDYDSNLIWSDLIAHHDLNTIYRSLCLNYIISENKGCDFVNLSDSCIILLAKYQNAVDDVFRYLNSLQDSIHLYVLADTPLIAETYQKAGYSRVLSIQDSAWICENKIIEISSGYQYVCMLMDNDLSSEYVPSYDGKSLFYSRFENLLGNGPDYIERITKSFEDHKYIGVLFYPMPDFGSHFASADVIDDIPYSTDGFWIRAEVLKQVLSNHEVIDLTGGVLNPVLKSNGYCYGTVESDHYAAMDSVNEKFYLQELKSLVYKQMGKFHSFTEMKKNIFCYSVKEYIRKHRVIYIYGTGGVMREYLPYVPRFDAFVESTKNMNSFMGKPVLTLNELQYSSDVGIIVCMNRKNQAQVLPLLEKAGFSDALCID
ncbi:rhamnan synthesis F family protein [Dialister sp.]|uniref:rhamnan synthesis F family protein n=1 Tax=Dialister sp. TaxID=1955814 RepID=UPI002E7FF3EF|nr:rhamnan synthesis F family protein [Dialister sp.]MEE3453177.1 rhamnan synthesis F family protein [Dialister sp.]